VGDPDEYQAMVKEWLAEAILRNMGRNIDFLQAPFRSKRTPEKFAQN
jgi:hypothetical protein